VTSETPPLELASALHVAGRLAEAEPIYRRILQGDPREQTARNNLIALVRAQERWAEAEALLREAIELAPDDAELRQRLAVAVLADGRYAEGWPLFEARRDPRLREYVKTPPLPIPEWDGGPVEALLAWPEQGFGDAIQFARFLPVLATRGIRVTVLCRPELLTLFQDAGLAAYPAQGGAELPAQQAWSLMGSLPGRMGVTLETLPPPLPIRAEPTRRGGIGIMTSGHSGHRNDANRSLPPAAAAALMALPGAVSLDPRDSGARDFRDTAGLIAGLDQVVSVDTAVAHLAGSMGKPTAVLLPRLNTDWRWLRGRTDCPWYPSLTLYRQAEAGDWEPELVAVRRDLAAKGLI
jgi:hypothetical protein